MALTPGKGPRDVEKPYRYQHQDLKGQYGNTNSIMQPVAIGKLAFFFREDGLALISFISLPGFIFSLSMGGHHLHPASHSSMPAIPAYYIHLPTRLPFVTYLQSPIAPLISLCQFASEWPRLITQKPLGLQVSYLVLKHHISSNQYHGSGYISIVLKKLDN